MGYVINGHFTGRRVGVDSGSGSDLHKTGASLFSTSETNAFSVAFVLLLVSVSQVTGLKDTKKKAVDVSMRFKWEGKDD